MPSRRVSLLIAFALVVGALSSPAPRAETPPHPPFRDPELPIERRIDDLIGRLTLDEKVSLMVERGAPIPRLGIAAFPWWNEALHGVARAGRATVFPQAIGLAATWDPAFMQRVATAISDEARAMHNDAARRGKRHLYQGLVFWSPNINIVRDPRWGRGHETYGEDPFLTGVMGAAFVKGMQGDDARLLKTVATAKHFAVHSGPEPLRHRFDAEISDADLWDTYLPAFRTLVVEAQAASVMCAYNAVRGLPACGSPELLDTILRSHWGFRGYVVSDCGAVQDIYLEHRVRKTAAEGAAMALRAGTDLECGSGSWAAGSPDAFASLTDAVAQGLVREADIDQALRRLLHAQFRLGVYDPPARVPWSGYTREAIVNSPAHRALALEAARKSIVLLKNDGAALPLRRGLGTIAVIGPNAAATEVLKGNYSGTAIDPVSVLDGIRAAAGSATRVVHVEGGPLAAGVRRLRPVPASALFNGSGSARTPGLRGSYYDGFFEGAPLFTRVDPEVRFDWADGAPDPRLDDDRFSVRWTGEIQAPATGSYALGLRCATHCRLFVDNRLVAQGRSDHEVAQPVASVEMRAGRSYPIRIELEHQKYDAIAELLWEPPSSPRDETSEVAEAVATARVADAVVLVLGLDASLEGEEGGIRAGAISGADLLRLDEPAVREDIRRRALEPIEGFVGGDRTSLDLPRPQQQLLEAVVGASAGKPVVLVLLNGSALSVTWADAHVPAIVEAWYPGQAGGTAVADVLFGAVSPGGRLPVTFYRSADQLPAFDDYAMRGRTYRYFAGDVLYPFGHGLSYTTFGYRALEAPPQVVVGASVPVSVEVRNTGTVAADEVVQLYLSWPPATAHAPIRSLRGVERVTLAPGERRTVRFTLDERAFSLVGEDGERRVLPGRYRIVAGGKQPGQAGSADAMTTDVRESWIELTGAAKTIPR